LTPAGKYMAPVHYGSKMTWTNKNLGKKMMDAVHWKRGIRNICDLSVFHHFALF